MASSITLNFDSIPAEGSMISFLDSITGIIITEFFRDSRSDQYESENDQNGRPVLSAVNYITAVNLDYNATSLYTINKSGSSVIIIANNVNSQFTMVTNNPAITPIINNETPPVVFSIDSITISDADTDPCNNVKITVTTNEQADSISSPISQAVATNPFIIDIFRGENILVSMVKDGVTVFDRIEVPKLLSTYFSANVVQSPSSASVSVVNSFSKTPLFSLQYSLDNSTWQTSNYFSNLAEGDYTAYIKDDLGCTTSIDFSVTEFTSNIIDYSGICEISNINSIRYKENEVWSESVLKTPYNTLSFEEDIRQKNCAFTQFFNKADVITTQIKTNYSDLEAKIIDDSSNETPLLISKMTANMDITDVRDGYVLASTYNGNSYTSVKFNGGKVYDPITLADLSDYNIGSNVPSWMNADDYINIESVGWYKILDIIYSVDAYVVIINLLASDFPIPLNTSKKITSIYNVVDWENYEFAIDFSTYEGCYKVQIDISDSNFGDKSYLSEWLNIKPSHSNTLLIEAYNSENNEINYNTGFSIKLRLPKLMDLIWSPTTEQDIYVTDTNTIPLENKYRGFWELTTGLLPTVMAEKLTLVLLQDRLFINGISYQTEGEITSKPIGGQYQIKANLVKSDYVFDSNSNKGLGIITLEGTLLAINPSGGFLLVE